MHYSMRFYRHFVSAWLHSPFRDVQINAAVLKRIKTHPIPQKRYAVFFTARSGASWLTDAVEAAGVLGAPGEYFNPDFVPTNAQAFSATDIRSYVELLMRARGRHGIFGAEITYSHLRALFRSEARFLEIFSPTSHLWLIREDPIAQAVSLARMQQTRVAHAVHTSAEAQARAESSFTYDARSISGALHRLMWEEDRLEAMICRYDLQPLRLSYEGIMSRPKSEVIARIGAHVGVPLTDQVDAPINHERLTGTKAAVFADQFRSEHRKLVARLDRRRAARLAALHMSS